MEIKGKVLDQMTELLTQTGYLKDGTGLIEAFQQFIGNENFEERADPEAKWIDEPVLKYITQKFGK